MDYSILNSVKKMLGLTDEYDVFDMDIIMHINTVFSILSQMGVGTDKTFSIQDSSAKWSDFLNDNEDIEAVKTYVYMKVRMMFDPPTNTGATDALNNVIKELEYRLYISEQNRKEYS